MFNNRAYITDGFYVGSSQITVFCYNQGVNIQLSYSGGGVDPETLTLPLTNYNAVFDIGFPLVQGMVISASVEGFGVLTPLRTVNPFPEIVYPPSDRNINPFANVTFKDEKLSNFVNVIYTSEIL